MSGGLTPCRQLRQSSRREHVKASKSYMEWKKNQKEKQTTHKSLKRESQVKSHKSLYSTTSDPRLAGASRRLPPLRSRLRAGSPLQVWRSLSRRAPEHQRRCTLRLCISDTRLTDPTQTLHQELLALATDNHLPTRAWQKHQKPNPQASSRTRPPPCNHTHPPPPLASTPPWPAEVDSRGQRIHPEIAPVVRDSEWVSGGLTPCRQLRPSGLLHLTWVLGPPLSDHTYKSTRRQSQYLNVRTGGPPGTASGRSRP